MNRALPWIVALLISLTANGVMTGIVLHRIAGSPSAADVIGSRDGPPHRREMGPRREGGFNIRAFVRSLPEAQREQAHERFRQEREAIRDLMLEARDAQRAAEDAMLADPYDAEAVAEALDTLREQRFEIERVFEAIVLDLAAELPAEDRLRALEAGRSGPRRRGRGEDDRRPPPQERF